MTLITHFGDDDPEVSVCIPSYVVDPLKQRVVLNAIEEHTGNYAVEVVVADCQGQLRGYTAPQNEAMAAARANVLVAMNDDVIVCRGWLDPLLQGLSETSAWCATPDQTHTDGPQVFAPYCMAWKREGWEALDGLDERFKWWCSDIDIARRMMDAGHPPIRMMLPVPGIAHLSGVTATGPQQAPLIEMALQDLDRFREKWGVTAEQEKHRLAALVCPEYA